MYVDAFVDIAKAGKINGSKKNIDRYRQTYAFGAGTKKMYDYLDDNPELMSAPVDYTNDIRSISALDNFISINNAVDIDLYGQVNAESAGIKQISGAGGQLDFVLGAYLSKGGKSFVSAYPHLQDQGRSGAVPYPPDAGKRFHRYRRKTEYTLCCNRIRQGELKGSVYLAESRGSESRSRILISATTSSKRRSRCTSGEEATASTGGRLTDGRECCI